MAGILKVDDLRGNTSAGDITITGEGGSGTMQLQQGVIKAWNVTNDAGTTIYDSLNISSLTDDNTGRQKHNVTNNFGNSNPCPTMSLTNNYNQEWVFDLGSTKWATGCYTGSSYADSGIRTMASGDLA
jgi:hypothetical protein